ncbi:hypothetical protein [Geminocystis sp. NIES-3709]|uniref:hypothetical protein n=1 Tax=Geminocystis sp. NIES-3709 TaxID=1617448 RepID=UPI0005FCBC54|nr:hypothetical protein [Geminocystis sp. NIES-3709]BAQ64729.1 hypothetical protein GM3709_1494 [Geminocystis sp. NIES-3709]
MTFFVETDKNNSIKNSESSQEMTDNPILCNHCKRTATNGIKCKGICVADSDY